MKKMHFVVADKLFANSHKKSVLKVLELIFDKGIPFSAPHKIKIEVLRDELCVLILPDKRINHNHIGTMHAIAQACVGELAPGVLLIKNFSAAQYRIVLSKLEVEYHKMAKGQLRAETAFSELEKAQVSLKLDKELECFIPMKTQLWNPAGELVSSVSTIWQLKSWDNSSRMH